MKLWCLQISQKANQILDRFLPYEARAKICQNFGWIFGRFEDTKHSEPFFLYKKLVTEKRIKVNKVFNF